MENIQKKSLQHVSEILKSFDTYPVYNSLVDTMGEHDIDNATVSIIVDKYQVAISEQTKKINDAKSWIDALISDIK